MRHGKKAICELLSPAGSFDAARAAVNAGADAIYMGGPYFSARAYAESSEEEMLLRTIEFCHLRGVRVFMTLNTLIKEREFAELSDYIGKYADAGLDGVIVQDLGVMRLIREEFPELKLHVSTQAAVTGPYYAGLLMKMGAGRIVLARELSLKEIKNIYEKTGAELEVFAHGAMCYSCSGMCLMSSFIGGRSGNRGKCAGTCRLPFDVLDENKKRLNRDDEHFILSMRDLNTVKRLCEMLRAGVYSFKIEGRMKSPLYVAAVTSVYRKYLDAAVKAYKENAGSIGENYAVNEDDMVLLSEVFERGGHTDGYLDHRNGREMLTLKEKQGFRQHDELILKELKKKYLDKDKPVPIFAKAAIHIGENPELILSTKINDITVTVNKSGRVAVSGAIKSPVTKDDITDRLSKFGGTDFTLKDIETEMDDGDLFLPLGSLNELRRKAAEELRKEILDLYKPSNKKS